MKTTLWLTTFSMFLTAPLGFSKTEVETLRSTVSEQERQIRQLEEENMKLRSLAGQPVKAPTETTAAPKSTPSAAATAGSSNSYTVRAGDTLAKIARTTGTSAETLTKLNGIKDARKLSIGQKLKLPGETKVATAASPANSAPAATAAGETYIIRNGDTFYSIAKKHRISPESIADANPGIKASELRTGQLIRLNGKAAPSSAVSAPAKSSETVVNRPAATAAPASKPAAEAKPAPAPLKSVAETKPAAAPSPAASAPSAPAKAESTAKTAVHSVTIDGEMTYGEFASKHGTQIERLNELNGLDLTQNTVLAKGSELYVSAQP